MIEMFGVVGGVEAFEMGRIEVGRGEGGEGGSIQLHVRDSI